MNCYKCRKDFSKKKGSTSSINYFCPLLDPKLLQGCKSCQISSEVDVS